MMKYISTNKNSRGIAIIELSLILPLLFLFIFASIDFVRYLQTKSSLDKAAEIALNVAQRAPYLDRNPNALTSNNSIAGYKKSLDAAITKGSEFANIALVSEDDTSIGTYNTLVQNISFEPTAVSNQYHAPSNAKVGILFPCQEIKFTDHDGNGEVFKHNIEDTNPAGGCNPDDDGDVNDDHRSALEDDAIIALTKVDFKFITPFVSNFLGIKSVVGRASGKREMAQMGGGEALDEDGIQGLFPPSNRVSLNKIVIEKDEVPEVDPNSCKLTANRYKDGCIARFCVKRVLSDSECASWFCGQGSNGSSQFCKGGTKTGAGDGDLTDSPEIDEIPETGNPITE